MAGPRGRSGQGKGSRLPPKMLMARTPSSKMKQEEAGGLELQIRRNF